MRTTTRARSTFSSRLIELRQARGLTQDQLAAQLQVTRDAIAYYENRARNPSADVIERLAAYFEVSADDLIGRNNDGPRRRGRQSKLSQCFQAVEALPRKEQDRIIDVVSALLGRAKS
jgi:transcriptional regulator with XRE-family HTH domain